jgi:peptidoglycan-associated lipoprotein
MKHSLVLKLLVVSAVLFLGPVGCQPKPGKITPVPASQVGVRDTSTPEGSGQAPPLRPGTEVTSRTLPPVTTPPPKTDTSSEIVDLPTDPESGMKRNEAFFKANTVYFDFDKSSVKSSERSKIEAVANHLKSEATHKVKVEGHCDERGTEGYNLSLGERRALAVRKYLIDLGISPDRVYTISFGEARPAMEGHTESAWSQNRRGEFILLVP